MSVVTRRIYHISAASTTLLNTQMGVEDSADGDLGFRMWCGRDDVGIGPQTGTITKFLAKDRNARVISLTATSRVLVTSGADITASAAAFTPSGDFDVTAGGDVDIDATGVFRVDVGGTGLLRIAHDGITPDITFNDYHIDQNFTQHYVALCDGGAEALQYISDFGEVSIFEALHTAVTSGGASATATQVVYGTGGGISSSANLTFASDVLALNGKLTLKNSAYGTATTATWTGGSNDIAANFSTGKDLQLNGNVDDDVTSLSLTAPTGGDVKGMVLLLRNSEATTIDVGGNGGGSGWYDVLWSQDGVDLASSYVTVDAGGFCQIMLEYVGSTWFGSVTTFPAVPA
jgi:hypothetical protein